MGASNSSVLLPAQSRGNSDSVWTNRSAQFSLPGQSQGDANGVQASQLECFV